MKKVMKAVAALMLIGITTFLLSGCVKKGTMYLETFQPQSITRTTAICGGNVMVIEGSPSIDEIGVCWSKSQTQPTVEDNHLSTAYNGEPYKCTITGLEPGGTYRVRAYVRCGREYKYDENYMLCTTQVADGDWDGHDYIDLGLPSGALWAICNVGAEVPEDNGGYFAWGETIEKTTYNWASYKYSQGESRNLTKYCTSSNYGYNGFIDNEYTLLPEDDAATANWGINWHTPTYEEWVELIENCTIIWNIYDGIFGWLCIAPNGNSLFFPAAGGRFATDPELFSYGVYWSSSLFDYSMSSDNDPTYARSFLINSDGYSVYDSFTRSCGLSVRAVRSAK